MIMNIITFQTASQLVMKVKVRTVLKSSARDFECFDDQQIIFPCGNTLCIKEVGRNEAEFICLSKHLQQLYSFKPATNKKGVFTAEKVDNYVEIALYNLAGQRKSINLTHQSQFFIEVESIELLVDDYDNNIVYGSARNKEGCCIFLGDFSKNKVLAVGYLPFFQDIKVDGRQNMTLSLCGHNGSFNYVKNLRYGLGQWEIEQYSYKKISQSHGVAIVHEILMGGRILFATKNSIYIFEDMIVLQILEMPQGKQIASIVKIPKGFLVLMENQTIQLYIEDSDQVTYIGKGQIPISLEQEDSIHKMHVSYNSEEVLVRTSRNNLYRWKSEHFGLDVGHSDMEFCRVESSCCNGELEGSLSISTGKRLCLLAGSKTVTIWSLESNELVLSTEFSVGDSKRRGILASAINPDGNSFLLAFEDRIRIYKILLTKFKFYAEFFIKRCSQIVYSHGGQLVACRYGKGSNACIQIINLLRLTEVNTIKVQAEPLQIVWNELDDEIIVSAENRTVQVFKVSENIRTFNIKFDSPILHVRLDYRVRKILVSTEGKISVLDGGDVIDEIVPPIKSFHYVFPLYGMYFIVSRTGALFWSSSLRFETYGKFSLFTQNPFQLMCRNGLLVAYTSYQDALVLECQREGAQRRASDKDVVMVEREQIMSIFDKIKSLDSNFDMLQTATQVKLEEEKTHYENALSNFKAQYTKEIKFLNSQFNELTISKLRQEKENEKTFDDLESGQVRNVNDLELMFTRKFALEKEKFMELEQRALEEKQRYERVIYDLEAKYHREVGQIREQYAKRTKEEAQRVEQLKKHNLLDKERLNFKLLDLEEQNEVAIAGIQQDKDQIIDALRHKVMILEADYDTLLIKYHNQEEKLSCAEEERQSKEMGSERMGEMLKEANNRVKLLQAELAGQRTMIEEKNQVIREQTHQIEGLQKAKCVLSYRTTEIRRELEPKEALIDKLKSQLFKLDDEYKKQKRTIFELSQKIQKYEKMGEVTKRENFELKAQLRQKEKSHDELCCEIFMIVNTIDPKEWNGALVKIYQAHIKDHNRFKNKAKRKDDTSEEINRHLIHVEQSLNQISSGKDKNIKRKEEEITKKMDENAALLYELNLMRKNEKTFEREKKEMGVALEKLHRELAENYKSTNVISTRAHTTATKRATASRDVLSREKSLLIDINEYGQAGTTRDIKSRSSRVRSRMSSASKTPVLRHEPREQSNKFFEIAKELQTCRNTIRVQDEVIEELNQRLFGECPPER